MDKIKIDNLTKFYALMLLNSKSMHGYELIKKVSEKSEKKVSPGQIYPFLALLEKNKLIVSKEKKQREKKVYSLTLEGEKFIKKILSRFGELIELSISPRLTVCVHCGCKVFESRYTKKIKGRKTNFCCKYCAKTFKKH